MKSEERLFWIGLVVFMILSRVVMDSGLAHRVWPARFEPPCVRAHAAANDPATALAQRAGVAHA